jgi:hypothetical protein
VQRLLALAAVLAALAASTHALASSARTFAIRGDVKIGAYAVRADGSFSGAIDVFGEPTSARHTYGRESCRASWPNHGLTIDFYNLGGADACDPDAGRFSRAYMRGNHWLTTKHLKIGDPVTKLRALYPTARFHPGEPRFWPPGYWLVTRTSAFGTGGSYPGLLAESRSGRVSGFQVRFPAGGD